MPTITVLFFLSCCTSVLKGKVRVEVYYSTQLVANNSVGNFLDMAQIYTHCYIYSISDGQFS